MTREQRTQFGRWIREARERCLLAQADVAGKVGMSQGWVSQVERATAVPTRHEVAALAVAVSADALEALDIAGFLETPPWVQRLERKLDELIERVEGSRTVGR